MKFDFVLFYMLSLALLECCNVFSFYPLVLDMRGGNAVALGWQTRVFLLCIHGEKNCIVMPLIVRY